MICREATASMPSNGSSRKSSFGAGSSAAASDSFLRMPCEKSVDERGPGRLQIHQLEEIAGAVARGRGLEAVDLGDERQASRVP